MTESKGQSRDTETGNSAGNPATHRSDRIVAYAVGFGKPPVHTRFQPGRSGNPNGRPKNSRNLKTIIRQTLTEPITVREGNRRRWITRLEAVVLRQMESALKGNDRATLATLKIAAQVGLLEDSQTAFEAPDLTPVEQQLVDEAAQKLAPQMPKAPARSPE